MEAKPNTISTKNDNKETILMAFELDNNGIKYLCDLIMINEDIIKINISDKENKLNTYEKELNLSDFININKYFKIFDSLKELVEELINIIKDKKIEIENCKNNIIILKIHLITRNNNIAFINLPKVELKEKDKYNYLFDEISQLKKINKEKDNEINNLKEKIKELEIKNLELKSYVNKRINEFEERYFNINNQKIRILNYKSEILKDDAEINFILSNINIKSISLHLLYSSSIEGENEEKFKSCVLYWQKMIF